MSSVDTETVAVLLADSGGTIDEVMSLLRGADSDREALWEGLAGLGGEPLAPLAAEVFIRSSDEHDIGPAAPHVDAFCANVARNKSTLAFADATDVLLVNQDAMADFGPALAQALMSVLTPEAIDASPILCGHRLTVLVRCAIGGAAEPFAVLALLVRAQTSPGEYASALAACIGAALDAWRDSPLIAAQLLQALDRLTNETDTGDADLELGIHRISVALGSLTLSEIASELEQASVSLDRARSSDPEGTFAPALASACKVVAAFANGDRAAGVEAARRAIPLFEARLHAGLNAHRSTWQGNSMLLDDAWLEFLQDLRDVSEALTPSSTWLDAYAAVGALGRVYEAERSLWPTASLDAVITPHVTSQLAANAASKEQFLAVVRVDAARAEPMLDERLHRIAAELGAAIPSSESNVSSLELERLSELAPRVKEVLGDSFLMALSAHSDDEVRAFNDRFLWIAVPDMEHPTFRAIYDAIAAALETNPRFVGSARDDFLVLVRQTIAFMADRYERTDPLVVGGPRWARPRTASEPPAVERELQDDFYLWLNVAWPLARRASLEVRDIATGRADVTVAFPSGLRFVTEVKRELDDASRAALETNYLGQAAEYSGGQEPFSQLLVLDLTDHSAGSPPLVDLLWATERRVNPDSTPQHVVVAVAIGNRPPPSSVRV